MPGLIYHVLLNVTNNPYEKYAFSVKTLKLRILVRRFELFFISIHNFKNCIHNFKKSHENRKVLQNAL